MAQKSRCGKMQLTMCPYALRTTALAAHAAVTLRMSAHRTSADRLSLSISSRTILMC